MAAGAVLVDIRPGRPAGPRGRGPRRAGGRAQRAGVAVRPASDARLPEATGYDVDVVVLCSEGYTSSLAADALRALGLTRATDVVGGFSAWAAAGLPDGRREQPPAEPCIGVHARGKLCPVGRRLLQCRSVAAATGPTSVLGAHP